MNALSFPSQFLGLSPFWGLSLSPCAPLWVTPLCWGPQPCPPEPQGHVSHASSHRKFCCSHTPEEDAKGRVSAGRTAYIITGPMGVQLSITPGLCWQLPVASLAPRAMRAILSSAWAEETSSDTTAGCQQGKRMRGSPTLGVFKGPGGSFLSQLGPVG